MVTVELAPSESRIYEFEVEAETFESRQDFRIDFFPELAGMDDLNVEVVQSWTWDGQTQEGWPASVEVPRERTMVGTLRLALTNRSEDESVSFDLRVELESGGQVPSPTLEELRLGIEPVDD